MFGFKRKDPEPQFSVAHPERLVTAFERLSTGSPLIVCGNPRSGTRMHANVLNLHPEILITDEFHDIAIMREILSNYRSNRILKKFSRAQAVKRQVFLAKMMWVSYSIDRIAGEAFSARIVGNKTPSVELKYQALENIFQGSPPKYVYCLRNAHKVLRSVKNLENITWNKRTVEENLQKYLKSVKTMEEMRKSFPDRVIVSVLDHLRPGMTNAAFFERIFQFAGVELDDQTRAEIDTLGAQNTMEAVKKQKGVESATVELTADEIALIDASRTYARIRRQYDLDPA